jgi:hypothetical protein
MHKVQKSIISQYYLPSSEDFRIYPYLKQGIGKDKATPLHAWTGT